MPARPFGHRPSLVRFFAGIIVLVACNALASAAEQDFFVSSSATNSVKRYDGVTGAYLGDFIPAGYGGLGNPQEIIFLDDGTVLVTGAANSAILRYDADTGAFLGPFTTGYNLTQPTKTTIGPDGRLYVSQWAGTEMVVRFDLETGAFIDEFTERPVPNGMGHVWDADGNMLVAAWRNGSNGNVHKYDPSGLRISIFIPTGFIQGPVNLWIEGEELIVLDWTQGTAERFRLVDGAYLGRKFGGLVRAEGVLFAPDGYLYIGEWGANRVLRLTTQGQVIPPIISGGGLVNPNDVAWGPPLSVVEAKTVSFGSLRSLFEPPVQR